MVIEIRTKPKYAAAEDAALLARMRAAGLPLKASSTARLYRIEAEWAAGDYKKAAAGLLADPLTDDWSLGGRRPPAGCWRAEVWLKSSVTDVVGESVSEAAAGFLGVRAPRVRFGHAFYFKGAAGPAAEKAAARALSNPLIHSFKVVKR
ncbi:MAG TPA: hypothetical protein PK523_00310 [Elusimicrobiales bacterium]|nr:hypothetical protein [Elusimicrobiales bacterium]